MDDGSTISGCLKYALDPTLYQSQSAFDQERATIFPTLNAQFILIVDVSVLLFLFVYGVSSLALMCFSSSREERSAKGLVLGAMGVVVSLAVTAGYFAQ